jgi:hypothetical protein
MFRRAAMMMCQDRITRAWKVDSVQIKRQGEGQAFWMSNETPIGPGLPMLDRPFRCNPPESVPDGLGNMVTQLEFIPTFIATWHDEPTDPFDMGRTVELLMKVREAEGSDVVTTESLFVRLSCCAHRAPRPFLPAVFHAVVTVVVAIVHFFKRLFVAKRHRLEVEDQAELAAEGPEGVSKELRG